MSLRGGESKASSGERKHTKESKGKRADYQKKNEFFCALYDRGGNGTSSSHSETKL